MHKDRHKMSKTRFYFIWRESRGRCNNKNHKDYPTYGGRGIKNMWNSFEEFRDDMHESYLTHVEKFGEKQTTIDRVDNDSHYCKSNCRWATIKEQGANKRNNHQLSFNGKTLSLSAWADIVGLKRHVISLRILRGWNTKKALTTPVRKWFKL